MPPSSNAKAAAASNPPTKRLFIFHGEDPTAAETHLNKLQKTLVGTQPDSILRCYGGETETAVLAEAITTPPLFTPHTVIIIYHYDKIHDKKILTALVNQLDSKNFLYLIKTEKNFHSTAFEQLIRKLPYAEVHIEFLANEQRLRTQIAAAFKAAKLSLAPDAQHALSQLFVKTPSLLKNELIKYTTYFSASTTVLSLAALKPLIAIDTAYASHDVITAVFSLQPEILLKKLMIFFNNGGNLNELVFILIKETQKLINYHEEHQQGVPDETVFKYMRIYYKTQQQTLKRRASHFPAPALTRLLASLLEIDETLKSQHFVSGHAPHATLNLKAKCQLERAVLNFS